MSRRVNSIEKVKQISGCQGLEEERREYEYSASLWDDENVEMNSGDSCITLLTY